MQKVPRKEIKTIETILGVMTLDPKYKAVVFDMDGTFMNTKVDYVKLANVVFDAMISLGVPNDVIDRSNGSKFEMDSGIKWMKEHNMKEELCSLRDLISKKATDVELENSDLAKPFKGSLEVLAQLKKKGYKTGILTRGGHKYAKKILSMFDVYEDFDAVIARDDFPEEESKPSPIAMVHMADALGVKPENILYFGDHEFDWLTAKNSGAGFYGVLSGGYTLKDWKAAGKDIAVMNCVGDLFPMI